MNNVELRILKATFAAIGLCMDVHPTPPVAVKRERIVRYRTDSVNKTITVYLYISGYSVVSQEQIVRLENEEEFSIALTFLEQFCKEKVQDNEGKIIWQENLPCSEAK